MADIHIVYMELAIGQEAERLTQLEVTSYGKEKHPVYIRMVQEFEGCGAVSDYR